MLAESVTETGIAAQLNVDSSSAANTLTLLSSAALLFMRVPSRELLSVRVRWNPERYGSFIGFY
jgi:hypothetical protein